MCFHNSLWSVMISSLCSFVSADTPGTVVCLLNFSCMYICMIKTRCRLIFPVTALKQSKSETGMVTEIMSAEAYFLRVSHDISVRHQRPVRLNKDLVRFANVVFTFTASCLSEGRFQGYREWGIVFKPR